MIMHLAYRSITKTKESKSAFGIQAAGRSCARWETGSVDLPRSLRLRPELLKVRLLVRSQFVLDAYQQADLRAFNLPFGIQYLVQLTHHLRLVGRRLLQKGDQSFHGVLQLPLKLGKSGLSLQWQLQD